MDQFKVIVGGKAYRRHKDDGTQSEQLQALFPEEAIEEDQADTDPDLSDAPENPKKTTRVAARKTSTKTTFDTSQDIALDTTPDVTTSAPDTILAHSNTQSSFDTLEAFNQRWAWTNIDLEAIRQNTKNIRRHVGAHVAIMAVVKANGYGHGAVETAHAALSSGARYLGVATVQEGIELRKANINAPILVLSEPPKETIPYLLQYNLITTVYSTEFALELGETADAKGATAPYHLKIDTGMNRVGVHYSDAGDFLRTIDFHRGLTLQGIFTHFATADSLDTLELRKQLDHFNHARETIRYMGIKPGIVHAAGSAALIRFRETHFDMVRPGLALYGLHASDITRELINLKPAMSVHARVGFLKPVPVGEGVGYGYTYRSPGNVQIATIPIGYADGLSRVLSNRLDVLVNGRVFPQVGAICMDACMFEVDMRSTPLKPRAEIEVGDEVILVGRSGALEITLEDMARALGTINYDLACRFGMRLARNYVGKD